MSFSSTSDKSGSKVDYIRILVPQYHPEIVPSRKTRESSNSLLQSHDGLRCRSSSEQESAHIPRRFDYAELDFTLSTAEKSAESDAMKNDYVNIEGDSTELSSVELPVVKDIRGSYVNLEMSRPSEVSQRRSSSSSRISSSGSPPPLIHPLSRWQSERLHASTKPIAGALHLPIHDYQNLHHQTSTGGARTSPQHSVMRAQSFQSPLRSKGTVPLRRNPNTGEYQKTQCHYDSDSSQSDSTVESSPVLRSGGRTHWRSQSEVRTRSQIHRMHRKTHVLGSLIDNRQSLAADYQNLWYLEPDSYSLLESWDGYVSTDESSEHCDPSMRTSASRRSVTSLTSLMSGDYSYDHLRPVEHCSAYHSPHRSEWKHSSDSEQADVSSLSSFGTGYSEPTDPLQRPRSTPPTSNAREQVVNRRSLHQSPPLIPKRQSAKASLSRPRDHLGLFKVHYLGQHPTDRFTGGVDSCLKKLSDSLHFTAKEVFVYVTSSVLRLTPPNSELLFASFAIEHILTVQCSAKNTSAVGVVFKRSKAKCVCHLFDCGDQFTTKIFLKTVKEALVSIREEDTVSLKNKAAEIEKSSILPIDLFGPVKYVGSCGIVPGDVITKTIEAALADKLKPSEMSNVIVNMKSTDDKRGGVLDLCENGSPSPLGTWFTSDVETVGCLVEDKRFVGLQILEEIPTLHILHFGQAVGAVTFLAVLRDKFGVTIDQGEFCNPRRQPSWKGLEPVTPHANKLSSYSHTRKHPVNKKLSFKKLICAITK